MFKKTCYECGAKVEKLYEGLCSKCLNQNSPPIEEIKPINFKYCNACKKINYNNQFLTKEEIENRLPDIVKKNIKINKNYNLKELTIKNFEIQGERVSFDIRVNCELNKQKEN